jgi:hypothetical protein
VRVFSWPFTPLGSSSKKQRWVRLRLGPKYLPEGFSGSILQPLLSQNHQERQVLPTPIGKKEHAHIGMLKNQMAADAGLAPIVKLRQHDHVSLEFFNLDEEANPILGCAYDFQLIVRIRQLGE